ncbi:MAG: phenylacetate-CoA oxygenase subunit PaaC [Gammaproteobacteria bacterium]|nr:phenylacetate-CoA oxygenase subunit PaaC [Gammaproteobacteria bacterium]NHN36407.1 phenylacetate-CoA oxygenase subunit PaaC [Pseudomaricurvus alcaniphilus]
MSATDLKQATLEYALRLGDDSVVLGHRISEWVSNGPFLEEDIALGNVALDYIGRARMFYGYAAELAGDGRTEDDFAYMRDAREYKNLLINELPKGDFAYTQVRQLLVDAFNTGFLAELVKSKDATLAAIAAKASKETRYHLRRSREWVLRLGDGTEESHQRAQTAVDALWGYTFEMFELDELEQQLVDAGIAVDTTRLKAQWEVEIKAILSEATLEIPAGDWAVRGGRVGYHTENLGHLLTDMQSVYRAYPGCQW